MRGLGRVVTLEDIGNIVLAVKNSVPVLVKDVATVEIGHAPRLGQFGFNKTDDAVEGVILMRTGEQAQVVLKRVEAKTRELNDHVLPKDVKVVPYYDRSDLVALTTHTVLHNLLTRHRARRRSCSIFFLYDVRSGLIVAVTVPLALLIAFIVPRPSEHPGEPAVDRRDRLRHSRRRRGRDGREHLPAARASGTAPTIASAT